MPDGFTIINDLIATCRESEEGFGKAATNAHNDELRTQFTRMAQIRAEFADQLQSALESLGIQSDTTGQVKEVLSRGWTNVEAGVHPESDQNLVEECRAGERATLDRYQQALSRPELPAGMHSILERQLKTLQESLGSLPGGGDAQNG